MALRSRRDLGWSIAASPLLLVLAAAACGGSSSATNGGGANGQADGSAGSTGGASSGNGSSGANGANDGSDAAGTSTGSDGGASARDGGGTSEAGGAMLGAYRWGAGSSTPGVGGPSAHGSFETWLGTNVPVALDFAPGQDWENQEGPAWAMGPWSTWAAARAGNTLVYTVQMVLTDNGTAVNSLDECAAGTDNSHWAALATSLVAHGLDRSILRLGHEFNGNWYPWNAIGRAATYISCFQQMVTSMRAVSGSHLRFDWNPGAGKLSMDAETAYPGDAFVDVIGIDLYDAGYGYPASGVTDAERTTAWTYVQTGDHMLDFWRDFARTHNKPMSFPEWGLWAEGGTNKGGGDNTIYLQNMHDFIVDPTNDVLYASYFDVHASDGDHQVSPGVKGEPSYGPTQFPLSASLFQKLFGR